MNRWEFSARPIPLEKDFVGVRGARLWIKITLTVLREEDSAKLGV